jgi:hypothetical protein
MRGGKFGGTPSCVLTAFGQFARQRRVAGAEFQAAGAQRQLRLPTGDNYTTALSFRPSFKPPVVQTAACPYSCQPMDNYYLSVTM